MLAPNYDHEIPERTIQVAKAAFPKGNVIMKIHDELGHMHEDEAFEALYPQKGQPSISPSLLALTTVLQYLEDMTDRQAANAVRGRIDWKYALGLELTDPGFDHSVLSEFRQRLSKGKLSHLLLDKILVECTQKGLLEGKKKQWTDSTHILGAIRTMNRLELVGETMRRVLDDLTQIDPSWMKKTMRPAWGKRYSRRIEQYRLPKSKEKRQELAQAIGRDGHCLLEQIEKAPLTIQQAPILIVFRRIWCQQFYLDNGQSQWRDKKKGACPQQG